MTVEIGNTCLEDYVEIKNLVLDDGQDSIVLESEIF